jgi:hypothetical protein
LRHWSKDVIASRSTIDRLSGCPDVFRKGNPLRPSRRRRLRRFRWKVGLVVLLSGGLLVSPVGAADDQDQSPHASVTPTTQPPPAGGVISPITQAAVASGVLACAGRVDQVAKFLTAGVPGNFWLFLPATARDQHIVSTSIEVATKEVPVAYASADFAPGMANGCGAIYESVVYWPGKCAEIAAKNFSGLPKGKNLGKLIRSLDAGGGARVFLMPAGSDGCISIKKELL